MSSYNPNAIGQPPCGCAPSCDPYGLPSGYDWPAFSQLQSAACQSFAKEIDAIKRRSSERSCNTNTCANQYPCTQPTYQQPAPCPQAPTFVMVPWPMPACAPAAAEQCKPEKCEDKCENTCKRCKKKSDNCSATCFCCKKPPKQKCNHTHKTAFGVGELTRTLTSQDVNAASGSLVIPLKLVRKSLLSSLNCDEYCTQIKVKRSGYYLINWSGTIANFYTNPGIDVSAKIELVVTCADNTFDKREELTRITADGKFHGWTIIYLDKNCSMKFVITDTGSGDSYELTEFTTTFSQINSVSCSCNCGCNCGCNCKCKCGCDD